MPKISSEGFEEQLSFMHVSSQDYSQITGKKIQDIGPATQQEEEEKGWRNQEVGSKKWVRKIGNNEKDVEYLMKVFENFDREVVEDVLREKKTFEAALDYLVDLENFHIQQQEDDILKDLIEDGEEIKISEDLITLRLNEMEEQDRLYAEQLQQEDSQQVENLENLSKKLNISIEELTSLKIQEKLQEFIYNFRFEEKMKKLQAKKNIEQRDLQMKKVKTLKESEQDVFRKFLEMLQCECFELLQLKYQQSQDQNDFEEIKQDLKKQAQMSIYEQGSKQVVKINDSKEFPSLVDDKVLKRAEQKRMMEYRMEMHKDNHYYDYHQNFKANNSEQLDLLINISKSFIQIQPSLIQEAYDVLNDANLVKSLLIIAFKKFYKYQNTSETDRVFQSLNAFQSQKNLRRQNHLKNGLQQRQQGFFTVDIIKKFRYSNYQKQNSNEVQTVYQTERQNAKKIYEQRNYYLKELIKAKKQGNHQQMEIFKNKADQFSKEYEQALNQAQMKIFQIKNNLELKDWYIDLHGIHLQEALKILNNRIGEIQYDLDKGSLQPNIDEKNHVLKIVCGRGSHSNGRPVLKFKVPKFLENRGFEFYTFQHDGVVLVRLIKK